MRSFPDPYRLSFLVPEGGAIERACQHFFSAVPPVCDLVVHSAGLVSIAGKSREAVFSAAAVFVGALCRDLPPLSIAGTMVTAHARGRPGGSDSWSIIVGAGVAFSPTSLPPHMPDRPPRLPQARRILTRALTSNSASS